MRRLDYQFRKAEVRHVGVDRFELASSDQKGLVPDPSAGRLADALEVLPPDLKVWILGVLGERLEVI